MRYIYHYLANGPAVKTLELTHAWISITRAAQNTYSELSMKITSKTISFGTYRLKDPEIAVYNALKVGYRYIDTAAVYKNEKQVFQALERAIDDGIVTRDEVHLTSKISPKDAGYDKAKAAILKSIDNLGKVDCMLLHWPGSARLALNSPKNKINRAGSIKALQEALQEGLVSQIGVSNFDPNHFEEVDFKGIYINQIEVHPLLWDSKFQDLEMFCQQAGIILQGYSCLGEGNLIDSKQYPEIYDISRRTGHTSAQILISWALQKDIAVAVKASSESRMAENLAASKVVLSKDDMRQLDALITIHGRKKFCWDPATVI